MSRDRELVVLREQACRVWSAGLAAADPAAAVTRALSERPFEVAALAWDLFAVGKAAGAMAQAALAATRGRPPARALVVTESSQRSSVAEALGGLLPEAEVEGRLRVLGAGHPLPTRDSERAGRSAEELVAGASDAAGGSRPLLVLLSGGGSALLAAPADGLTLEDEIETTALLQAAGADIGELNCVRRHLSRVKGGGLGRLAASRAPDGREVRVLVLSDVLGDALEDIASGPFYGDATGFADAEAACRRVGVWADLPASVAERLRSGAAGELPENPTPGELAWIDHEIVGSLGRSVEAAIEAAREEGLRVERLPEWLVGEARVTGAGLVERAIGAEAREIPRAWIGGGETVVTVVGSGVGGRAQELALGFAAAAEGRLAGPWVLLSVGTDGRDGPGEAAGALVDSETLERARRHGLEVAAALADNDASRFLRATGDLLVTGRTGTNVGDLAVLILG